MGTLALAVWIEELEHKRVGGGRVDSRVGGVERLRMKEGMVNVGWV